MAKKTEAVPAFVKVRGKDEWVPNAAVKADQWFIDMAPVVMAKTAELEAAGILEPSEGDADALTRNMQKITCPLSGRTAGRYKPDAHAKSPSRSRDDPQRAGGAMP